MVNDGSTDRTVDIIQEMQKYLPLTLINHQENHGPGHAFKSGFHVALDMADDDDIIVTIEADNTSDLLVLNKMLEKCRRGNDLVLASVYGEGKVIGAPLDRKIFSWCANSLIKAVFRIKGINTFTSFFRVYKANFLKELSIIYKDRFIEEKGFTCMLELLIKSYRCGYKICEVPMILDSNIRIGDSKMKNVNTIISYFKIIYRYGISRNY
jgi:dolichol-phosphate mannosyltransferase